MGTNSSQQEPKKSFWTTLPGIVTAAAALITATTGLIVALAQLDDGGSDTTTTDSPVTTTPAACEEQRVPFTPPNLIVEPVLVSGDADLFTGPTIKASVQIGPDDAGRNAIVSARMEAIEPGGDKTRGEGSKELIVYSAPDGFEVVRVENRTNRLKENYEYVDRDHAVDDWPGEGALVKLWSFVGDTLGDDIGFGTMVTIEFTEQTAIIAAVGTC